MGKPFKPGQSGNPKGRPPGTGKSAELKKLLEPSAPALVEKVKQMALSGDTTALRLCLERLIPPIRATEDAVQLPQLKEPGGLSDSGARLLHALADGQLTPTQATGLIQALAAQAKLIEIDDLEQRIAKLEETRDSA